MDAKDRSILTQVAAKIAAELAPHVAASAQSPDIVGAYKHTLDMVVEDLFDRVELAQQAALQSAPQPQAVPMGQAITNVMQAFPGAQAQGFASSGGLPDMTVEEKWAAFFESPNDWYDNRTKDGQPDSGVTLYGGTKPDFRHKTQKDRGGKYSVGLFLVDRKYGKHAPDWAWERLGLTPPANAGVAAPQGLPSNVVAFQAPAPGGPNMNPF